MTEGHGISNVNMTYKDVLIGFGHFFDIIQYEYLKRNI